MSKYWLTYFVYQNLHGKTAVFYFYLRKGIWLDDSGPKNLNFFSLLKPDIVTWRLDILIFALVHNLARYETINV